MCQWVCVRLISTTLAKKSVGWETAQRLNLRVFLWLFCLLVTVENGNPVLHYLEEVLQQGNPDTEDATPSNTLKLLVSKNETQNARPEQDAENYSFYSTPRSPLVCRAFCFCVC